jgi:hypothetical protein
MMAPTSEGECAILYIPGSGVTGEKTSASSSDFPLADGVAGEGELGEGKVNNTVTARVINLYSNAPQQWKPRV